MNFQNVFFNLFGGLGLFIYGMRSMSEGLQTISGDSLRRIIGALTNNRVVAVIVGLTVTTIVQSSSVTTVMVVGFVNSGLMTLTQAIGVVLGANIGTTITGWIIAIKITKFALPLVGLGVFFFLFSRNHLLKYIGQVILGIGLIFFGLQVMKSGLSDLKSNQTFVDLFIRYDAIHLRNILMAVAMGCILTVVVQSSSATLGITIALAASGLINFQTSAALILGENIGTTITAQIAAIGTNVEARRAARAHLLFNCFGVFVIICIFRPYVNFVEWLIPHDADQIIDGVRPYITVHIAATHSLFNIINVLLFLPFLNPLARFVTWLQPTKEGRKRLPYHLTLVDPLLLDSPALAIEQARREALYLGDEVFDILKKTGENMDKKKDDLSLRELIYQKEKDTDEIQKEITVFLAKVMESNLNEEQSLEVRSLIRVADELESIADYCESLAQYRSRVFKEKISFTDDANLEMKNMLERVSTYYEETITAFKNADPVFINKARVLGNEINDFADNVREAHLNRLNRKKCNPFAGLVFSDIMVAFRRIKNHTFNIAEAVAGLK